MSKVSSYITMQFIIQGARDVSDPGDKAVGLVRLELQIPELPEKDAELLRQLFPNTQHMLQRALLTECLIDRTDIKRFS